MTKMNLTEEQKEVFKLVVIILGVIAALGLIYLFSRAFVSKDLFKKGDESSSTEVKNVEIDYSTTIVGEIFNRPYKTYYVLIFDSTSDNSYNYQSIPYLYQGGTKIYSLDLNSKFNSDYKAKKESNPSAKTIEDFKFGEITLLKINNGEVSKYIEGTEEINKELGLNK